MENYTKDFSKQLTGFSLDTFVLIWEETSKDRTRRFHKSIDTCTSFCINYSIEKKTKKDIFSIINFQISVY